MENTDVEQQIGANLRVSTIEFGDDSRGRLQCLRYVLQMFVGFIAGRRDGDSYLRTRLTALGRDPLCLGHFAVRHKG